MTSTRLRVLCSRNCSTTISKVANKPTAYIPEPIAIPTAAVDHTPAAVVKPWIDAFLTKITPAPRKLTPVAIFEAIRVGSMSMPSIASISKKP